MPDFELRYYQIESVEGLRQGLREGHLRQILCAPTGSGKTLCAAHLIKEALGKGSKSVFIADRVALVTQTSQGFYELGIPHGVAQGENTFGRGFPVQICSAQTIEKRGFWPDLDLIIVDEAHTQRKATLEFIRSVQKPVIGLTATPFTKGLGQTYTNVVNVTTTDKLISEGWLAPLKVYASREIDMEGAARNNAGEWLDREVERRGVKIVGDIVSEWQEKTAQHFGGPVKTIAFSATVAHGEEMCRAFQAAGYDFRQISYRDKDDAHRQRLIDAFRSGRIQGLVSCEALAKGFDVPDVLCLIGARPYRKSLAAHVQQIGRVMRPSPGKEFALVLDFAGNVHGFYEEMMDFFAEGCERLDDGKRQDVIRREGRERQDVVCRCGYVLLPGMETCPSCGRERKRRSGVEVAAGRMEAVSTGPGSRRWKEDRLWTWQQICRIAIERKDGDERLARKFALAQYKSLYKEWPDRDWGFELADGEPDPRVQRKVKQQLIAWAKREHRNAR